MDNSWKHLDSLMEQGEEAEASALVEVAARLLALSPLASPAAVHPLRACALAVLVVARRLEARSVAGDLMKEARR